MSIIDYGIAAVWRLNAPVGVRLRWQCDVRRGHLNARLVNALVEPGQVVVDVGAHKGIFAERMRQLVGRDGHVYAIEPNPAHPKSLTKVATKPNFTYIPRAVSDVEGTARLRIPVHEGRIHSGLASIDPRAHITADVDVDSVDVPMARLDDLLASERRPIAFIKIDVEGHEPAVLRGAEHTLSSRPTLLMEIEQRHHEGSITDVFEGLVSVGYDIWPLFQDGLRPFGAFDLKRDQVRFLSGGFQDVMPEGYVNDFLFMRSGVRPPEKLIAT